MKGYDVSTGKRREIAWDEHVCECGLIIDSERTDCSYIPRTIMTHEPPGWNMLPEIEREHFLKRKPAPHKKDE